ncbi:MAG: alpha/beta fold hydrolase [Planctomycetota bacterium]
MGTSSLPDTPPLHCVKVTSGGATRTPSRWLYFLHGILGMGANWRSIARRWVDRHPDWGAVLVDLRMHGRSQAALPPHTLLAAARDLERLEATTGARCAAICAHSFATKVALCYATAAPAAMQHLWLLDADPSPQPARPTAPVTIARTDQVDRVLAALADIPTRFADRAQFIQTLEAHHLATSVAAWLAMNLEPGVDGWRLRLDLAAIHELLADYRACDGWRLLDQTRADLPITFVVGDHSPVVDADARFRMQALALSHPATRRYTSLANAGHWLHIDAPELLVEQLAVEF